MVQNPKTKKTQKNPLETLREELINPIISEFPNQFFGLPTRKFSGEISKGSSLEFKDVFSGQAQKNENLQKQIRLEKNLINEERLLIERKSQELQIQLKSIQEEVTKIQKITPEISQELQIASFEEVVSPGKSDLTFIEHILKSIQKARIHIEEAKNWLHMNNIRSHKKNVWGTRYKKGGAKYLLSGEHYLTRSAG